MLFAEASERYLQDKRAFNHVPDHMTRAAELIEAHCGAGAEVVVAINWSDAFSDRLRWIAASELPGVRRLARRPVDAMLGRRDAMVWPLAGYRELVRAMTTTLSQAGCNLAWSTAGGRRTVRRYDHHMAHAAHACLTGPFESALCAVVDGFGEWTATSFYRYAGGELERLGRAGPWGSWNRGSLGMFYGTVCGLCGFDPLKGEEWKVMGLAPYGEVDEELYGVLRSLLRVDGLELVTGCPPAAYRKRLAWLKDRARTSGSDPVEAADLARTGQEVFCDVATELLEALHAAGDSDNLVLTGGCALNSSWNGKVLERTALGAALLAFREHAGGRRERGASRPPAPALETPLTPFLGSSPSRSAVEALARQGDGFDGTVERPATGPAMRAGELVAAGRIVAWMRGRAEFGPRALGHRSILADPRREDMKDRLNAVVKHREGFRPFAPAILHEHGPEYFDPYQDSPYMDRTLPFRPQVRDRVPAVAHVDGTGRLQSVRQDWCPEFHRLLRHFHSLTGVPLVLNTSLNVMGRPIAHSVEDALGLFLTTGLDALVVDDVVLEKRPRGEDRAHSGYASRDLA